MVYVLKYVKQTQEISVQSILVIEIIMNKIMLVFVDK